MTASDASLDRLRASLTSSESDLSGWERGQAGVELPVGWWRPQVPERELLVAERAFDPRAARRLHAVLAIATSFIPGQLDTNRVEFDPKAAVAVLHFGGVGLSTSALHTSPYGGWLVWNCGGERGDIKVDKQHVLNRSDVIALIRAWSDTFHYSNRGQNWVNDLMLSDKPVPK